MKKRFLFVVVALFALVCLFSGCKSNEAKSDGSITVIVVDENSKELYNGKIEFKIGEKLDDLLMKHEEIKLEGGENDYGVYIDAVCGRKAVDAGETYFWSVYVNGETSLVGISFIELKDKMEVKLILLDWTKLE